MKLSVIIPAYNAEKSLERCIRSVMAGLHEDSEVIVVDDGSEDSTVALAERLAVEFLNIRLLRHPANRNLGVAASRNLGLKYASGEFIAFIDADDYCVPTRFDRSLEILDKNGDIDGVLVTVGVIFEEGTSADLSEYLPPVLAHQSSIEPDDFAAATLEGRLGFHISNMIFRSSLLDKSGVFDAARRLGEEDTDLWLRMALCGRFRVSDQDDPQVFYRRHGSNNWTPQRSDVLRDLMVLGKVLQWASTSPWVTEVNSVKLKTSFINKAFFCLSLARAKKLPISKIRVAAFSCRFVPGLLLSKAFWGHILF